MENTLNLEDNTEDNKSKTLIKYKREDILKVCIEYFDGDELAANVWINKYALKDSYGNIYENSPKMMHDRIISEIIRIENKYPNPVSKELLQELIYDFKYIIPQGSPMSGIGNNFQTVSLSNCFVIGNNGPSDSYGGIMKIDQEQVQLMKRRGGVGHDLSGIRPKGSPVKNSALTSTGVVPFMERFSNSTREVAQDGRRGALMLSISSKHPDSEDFIDAKMDGTKVTGANISVKIDNDFMKAVTGNGKYIQQYPIESDNPTITKEVDAKAIWDKIIHNAWKSAEPGVLFWDKMISESLPDRYADLGYKTVSTNPCVTGETLVYVADGRGHVKIKELADKGKDVPVFTLNEKGKVEIRTMRNPRRTGVNEKVYKVTLDDGSIIRTTANHKFRLKSGLYKRVDELEHGDSLFLLTKYQAPFEELFKKSNSKSNKYEWIKTCSYVTNKAEHRLIAEYYHGSIQDGYVIHHKDYNPLNNCPDNLQMMSRKDHNKLHAKDMMGDKNPMRRAHTEWSEEKWQSYRENMSKSTTGEKNGRYKSGVTNEDIKEHALKLTKELNFKFSGNDWSKYAKENGLPANISKFRKDDLFGGIPGLSEWAALKLNIISKELIGLDPRVIRSYFSLIKDGYDVKVVDKSLKIYKICEMCNTGFDINDIRKREVSTCSSKKCRSKRISINNKKMWNSDTANKIKETKKKFYDEKKENTSILQIKVYSDLKFELGRDPLLKEWEEKCKETKVVADLRKTASNNENFKNIKELALEYNHKVVSVEFDGYEDVYNGTVDDFHNFFSGGFETITSTGNRKLFYINQLQCGEIGLCVDDSCRLLVINLLSYVEKPFTKDAYFNYDKFKDHAKYTVRIMDDIVDLEIEKINSIIAKIKNDPEDPEIKRTEMDLWKRIKNKCEEGRRTGIGITAEGDMLAALGLTYGTKKATKFATEVHRTYTLEVFRSSNTLAKERGAFKIWDPKREKDHPYLERIKKYDEKLYKDLMKTGRRNIALLTVAPSGSVSILTQTSSGIEPVFMVAYKRRRKINPNDKGTRTDFIDDLGDHWEEYNVYHKSFENWIKITGHEFLSDEDKKLNIKDYSENTINMLIEKSPYHKALANDINWVEKVKMQGSIQEWICHSISCTLNLPAHVDEKLVNDVYIAGWKAGCKGLTVYRDGSRSGVLISKEEKKTEALFKDINAPKRPKELECSVMTFMNKGQKWIGFLGLLDGKPYELFTGLLDNFPIPSYVEGGKIIKTKKDGDSDYDFIYTDKTDREIRIPNLNHAFDKEFYDIAKTFSAILRHGMPLTYVIDLIDGLNLDGDLITTWKSGVKRMLKKFIKDGTVQKGKTCEECGSEALEYKEGCLTCMNCGSSLCSS